MRFQWISVTEMLAICQKWLKKLYLMTCWRVAILETLMITIVLSSKHKRNSNLFNLKKSINQFRSKVRDLKIQTNFYEISLSSTVWVKLSNLSNKNGSNIKPKESLNWINYQRSLKFSLRMLCFLMSSIHYNINSMKQMSLQRRLDQLMTN